MTFFGYFYTCCFENGQSKSHFTIIIAIHCILVSLDVYGEVLLLYVTIFDDWHCEYDRPWCCKFLVKILKWKMTVSHEVECSRRHVNMFWDHNNILDKDTSVRFERGVLFLLQTLDLFVLRTIHAKCNKSSYLGNQSSNDEARTCP